MDSPNVTSSWRLAFPYSTGIGDSMWSMPSWSTTLCDLVGI